MRMSTFRGTFFQQFCLTIFIVHILCSGFLFSKNHEYFHEEAQFHDSNQMLSRKNVSEGGISDEPASLASLDGEPSAYVHGCVNAITGQYCELDTDLILYHGTDPICLERSYSGGTHESTLGGGWERNHDSRLHYKYYEPKYKKQNGEPGTKSVISSYKNDHGDCYRSFYGVNGHNYRPSFYHLEKSIVNTSQGMISGQNNPCNIEFLADKSSPKIINGSGLIRKFVRPKHEEKNIYRLEAEIKPNGNRFSYSYMMDKSKNMLLNIGLRNRADQSKGFIAWKNPFLEVEIPKGAVSTHDGRWVFYDFIKTKEKRQVLEKVIRSDAPEIKYTYTTFKVDGNLVYEALRRKILPDLRVLRLGYYWYNHNYAMTHDINIKDADDPRLFRIKNLSAPVGPDETLILIYQFVYDLCISTDSSNCKTVEHGSTNVFNVLGHRTEYRFNKEQRLTHINKYHADGQIYTLERLFWGNRESRKNICLMTRDFVHNNATQFARKYKYDESGNVLVDSLYGNLTGHNHAPLNVELCGFITENGCDRYEKYQEYTDDGFNLLAKECDGFTTTEYVYEQGTNCLAAKYLGTESKWLRRTFYSYNDDSAVVKEVSDDGFGKDIEDLSGVTERKIIYYTQSTSYPAAFPLIIEEKCLDLATGNELLVHKVVNTYTNLAKISRQDHYDSNDQYAYSLLWEYDNRGNITKEVNALGQVTTRRYDANSNCLFEEHEGKNYHTIFTYDFSNRLIKEQAIHADGQSRTMTHRYDGASNKIATVDENGQETLFNYDPFGRLIEITYPSVLNEDKILCRPTVKKEYSPQSKVTKEIDARGVETHMSYNIRGQLTEIAYPDGTTEKNSYYLNGNLKESVAKNRTVTKYSYDCLGRPIETDIVDENGELLSRTSMSYSGFHLLSETDPSGTVTSYAYYPDGKIQSKKKGDYSIIFSYDALGRQNKTTELYGPNGRDAVVKTKEFDLLNRTTAEAVRDINGVVVSNMDYVYDSAGNICQTINYTQAGSAITHHVYNSHGVLERVTDAEGNATVTQCRYDYRNEFGQIVAYQETTDPKGNTGISISDVLGRIVTKIRKNAYGKIIQKQEHSYDLKGNLCVITDTIINEEEAEQEVLSIMQYDTCDRLVACYDAYGTPEQKQTKMTYNFFGQKESLIKNDGMVLFYTYDALGRLKSLQSSDNQIDYSYEYDLNSNPIKTEDRINGTATVRKYDQNGFMVSEELGNHLSMRYAYDYMGRTKKITLPDDSRILYQYHVNQLKAVSRIDSAKRISYTHKYQSYDYSGNLTQSILANHAGALDYTYDILGRLKSTAKDRGGWKEEIKSYDSIGNILEVVLQDGLGEDSSAYTYDDLYQITSEAGGASYSYSYDSHYNRRTKNGKIHRLNPLHQLMDDGISVYSYDANGNMQQKKSVEHTLDFTYDALDRLVACVKGKQKFAYRYDENNRRLSKTVLSLERNGKWKELKTIRYLYQGQNEIGSVDKAGKIQELRVLGLGKGAEIGAAVALEINRKVLVPIHDHIGNVACLIDSVKGTVVETYRYSSFGEERFDGTKAMSPWRFSSKRTDSESGWVYFGRRYYDPEIGRWATPDPIGRDGGPNLYAYVLNSPLTHFDLYGLFGMSDLQSALGNIGGRFGKLFSFLAQVPGHLIGFIGRDILPIPYVNHLVEFGGWCLRGQNPSAYDWSKHRSQLLVHPGSNPGNPNHIFVSTNGICVPRDEHLNRLGEMSETYGGVRTYGLHTAYNGIILDALETGCQKLGIPTNGQRMANRELTRLLNEQGENREETTIFMEAHSRGTETAYHLDPGLREKMEMVAFAPARIAAKGHYKISDSYISPLDGVPLLSPIGYYKSVKNGNIHFLPTTGNPISDHMYDNKYFKEVRKQRAKVYKEQFGKAA